MISINSISQSKASLADNVQAMNKRQHNAEIKRLLNRYTVDEKAQSFQGMPDSKSNPMQTYADSLRAQRQKAQDTSLKIKKLKYQFKDISSRIIRSKTSSAAKQAASQAKRELMRLKREKQSGNYDAEEIEAAIAHAKAMERVARKKVKHLEEEELAKASGGPCEDQIQDELDEMTSGDGVKRVTAMSRERKYNFYGNIEYDEDMEFGFSSIKIESDSDELSLEAMDSFFNQSEELSYELLEEMNESMKLILEDLGLDELSGAMTSGMVDMDPEDLKALKINHRNKEMKSIVEADSKYLKAMFEHYNNMISGQGVSVDGSQNMTIDIMV